MDQRENRKPGRSRWRPLPPQAKTVFYFVLFPFLFLALVFSFFYPPSTWLAGTSWKAAKRAIHYALFPGETDPDRTELPVYELRIKQAAMKKLEEGFPAPADAAMKWTFIRDVAHDYVSAAFWHGEKKLNVNARYRGDSYYHWGKIKKSWRIKFKREGLFNSQRRINLVSPKFAARVQNYLSYMYAHRLGVPAPLCYFSHVRLNGAYLGAMLFIEQVDKHFLINHRFPEGKIYYGDDAKPFWYRAKHWQAPGGVFQSQKSSGRKELSHFLELLKYGEVEKFSKEVSSVIDLDLVARWHAHMNLIGSLHQDAIHNVKVVFDPSKGQFVPVVWDANGFGIYGQIDVLFVPNPLLAKLSFSPEYLLRKNQYLWRMLNEEFPLEEQQKFIGQVRNVIESDVRSDPHKQTNLSPLTNEAWEKSWQELEEFLVERDRLIRGELQEMEFLGYWERNRSPKVGKLQPVGRVHIQTEGLSARLIEGVRIGGSNPIPFDRIYLIQERENRLTSVKKSQAVSCLSKGADSNVFWCDPGVILYPKIRSKKSHKTGDYFNVPILEEEANTTALMVVGVSSHSGVRTQIPKEISLRFRNAVTGKAFPWLHWPLKAETSLGVPKFSLKRTTPRKLVWSGKVELDRSFVVEAHETLHVQPGTDVRMGEGVSLVVKGELVVKGTESSPISFKPQDPERPWGSILLLQTRPKAQNILEHVFISGGSEGKHEFVRPTGMLAVHHAPIRMAHVTLAENRGEDALNFKYSDFSISDLKVRGALRDAIDLDFSQGVLTDVRVEGAGNDGLDCSFSDIQLIGAEIIDTQDKGISIGERTVFYGKDMTIRRAGIGIAVKDESVANVEKSRFLENGSNHSIYIKKNEFSFPGCLSFLDSVEFDKERGDEGGRVDSTGESHPVLWGQPCEFQSSFYDDEEEVRAGGLPGTFKDRTKFMLSNDPRTKPKWGQPVGAALEEPLGKRAGNSR